MSVEATLRNLGQGLYPYRPAAVQPPSRPAMRVVYFNYEWDLRASSGAATHISELTRNLEAMGHSVAVHHRHRAADGTHTRAALPLRNANPARAVRTRLSPYLHEAAALARALRAVHTEADIIRRERPDVVLTRYSLHQFSSLLAARRCGVPIVFEVNAPLAFEYRRYRPHYRLAPRLAEWTEARTLAGADGVFVVSSALKAYLASRGVRADDITVIPNGADPSRFKPPAAEPGVGRRGATVGFVGSFGSYHGVDLLRQAMARVLPVRSDVRFLLVGSGRHSQELEAFCRAAGFAGRTLFTGFVPPANVPGLMAGMDIVLAPYPPSDFFYFSPIKLFEYMACGKAILAARVGQIAEVLADGITGLLYDPSDADAFVEKLLRLVDDGALRAHLGANARRTVERDYTWRINAERVAAVLAQARNRKAKRAH